MLYANLFFINELAFLFLTKNIYNLLIYSYLQFL